MPRRFRNTRRENRLEELGRVDAEKAYTSKGKRNLREEKDRIRSELKTGGRAATRPMTPDQKRKPRKGAGPSAPSPRKKRGHFNPFTKTHGGGPDAGNIGKLKDSLSKVYDKYKDKFGKKVPSRPSPEDIQRIKDKMPKKYPPKREMQPLRKGGSVSGKMKDLPDHLRHSLVNQAKSRAKKGFKKGGSAKGPNRPRPTGPHMWVRGDKRKKYASGGAVMAGKKVGCQIK